MSLAIWSKFLYDPPVTELGMQVIVIGVGILAAFGIAIAVWGHYSPDSAANLKARYLSASVMAAVLLPCVWLGGIWFALMLCAITWLAVREFLILVTAWKVKPFRLICECAVISLVLAAVAQSYFLQLYSGATDRAFTVLPQFNPFYVLPLIWIIVILAVPIVLQDFKGMSVRESHAIFAIVYFAWFLPHLILLRSTAGFGAVMFLCFAVVLNDIFAFVVGKLAGHIRLVPTISPKKTREGALGGTAATFASVFLFSWLLPQAHWIELVVYATLISILSPMGDLVVSVIKRDVGTKESSTVIPGHGGVLDRVGSFVLISPVFYLIYSLLSA